MAAANVAGCRARMLTLAGSIVETSALLLLELLRVGRSGVPVHLVAWVPSAQQLAQRQQVNDVQHRSREIWKHAGLNGMAAGVFRESLERKA
jgi:hypothetical protein